MSLRASRLHLLAGVLAVSACSEGFGQPKSARRLSVEILDYERVAGTRPKPLALVVAKPQPFRVLVKALDANGNVDTSYNGYVRISSKPGGIERISDESADSRSLELVNGESAETVVRVTNAFGPTFILADDLGYLPGDALGTPPPACSNGFDDDGDGRIDYPADEGCAFPNDNSETGGSFAQGASQPIWYRLPRIADVRGLTCDENGKNCSGNGITVYPREPILLDTGFRERADGTQVFDFDMVVTRIASDGFYVSDVKDKRGGFNNVFSFNFNAPPRMRVCDRLKTFGGTAQEFFGFTQLGYPTWTLEEWDPQQRPCLVPEPRVLGVGDLNPEALLPLTGSLVRVLSVPDKVAIKVSPKLGPGNMPERGGVFVPKADAGTNCDFNGDGRIDFSRGVPEERCARACQEDPECTEYSNFIGRSTFRITVTDLETQTSGAIQADATTSASFKPLQEKGRALKAFSGTLHYFSGGSQFTLEARCKDDIVLDLEADPLPSDKACVFPRTALDENPQ
jgi:hypothetical protein